jgi:glucose/arabinose dehydrogenase
VTSAPGDPDTLYVVEQAGTIRIVRDGKIAGTFLDIHGIVKSGGEQGLLSMAFSPQYASNHLFYVSYTDRNGNSLVARYRASNGRGVRSSGHILLGVHQPFTNHNGGQLQFDKRGYLYFGLGDGGSEGDPNQTSQNMHSRLGKLLRSQQKTPGPTPGRSSGSASAIRGASRSTRRRATSGSATSARTRGRRSTSGPRRSSTSSRTTAGAATRAIPSTPRATATRTSARR